MADPFIGLYVKVGDLGAQDTLNLCKRAKDIGYNGLLAWWNNHARPEPSDSDKRDALWLDDQLQAIGFRYLVQTAYTNDFVGSVLGSSVMERGGAGDPQCCLADDRVLDLWRQWAERGKEWHPNAAGWLLAYDEIRRTGSHSACRAWLSNGGYGAMLAAHAKRAMALYREVTPDKIVSVWNDMFDPAVNAHPGDYEGDGYRVQGGWGGSWEGLDPAVLISNWSTNGNDEQEASFPWWGQRGFRQLYWGYYDYQQNDYGDGISPGAEMDWIGKSLAAAPGSICGYVFTTWNQDDGAWRNLGRYFPGPDLVERMASFPAVSSPPEPPAPTPQPEPTPTPIPDSYADVEAALRDAVAATGQIKARLGKAGAQRVRAAIQGPIQRAGELLKARAG